MDAIKDKLAELNGTTDERRREVIAKTIGEEIGTSEELCIIRKTLKFVLEVIKELHDGEIDTSRFDEYCAAVEAIIAEKNEIYGKEKKNEEDF